MGDVKTVMTTMHRLETAEADIAYDVHGPLPTADGRPPLFMIGQPMDASGFGTLLYQWRFNGANLFGRTNSLMTVTNASSANVGSYDVVVNDLVWILSVRHLDPLVGLVF